MSRHKKAQQITRGEKNEKQEKKICKLFTSIQKIPTQNQPS